MVVVIALIVIVVAIVGAGAWILFGDDPCYDPYEY